MIETGTLLHDRFLIDKQIGVGGMGAVYRAVDQKFGSTVAIKETFFNDPELSEAFEREARLLNALHHPIFPHVSDHFSENDGHFLVMEYIEGEDLSDLIKRGERFDLDTVTKWAFDLLDGLDYLHSQDPPIIHRDIKPSNLKLTSRGNIVLLDFGMAKETSGNTQGMRSVFGYSRRYSPLEQIEGTGTDFRSDIFSLGATIYHLLTGSPPVDVLKRASAIVARRSDPLELASDLNHGVPERVAAIISSAMALDPDERFISARAMWNALEHALTEERAHNASAVTSKRPENAESQGASEKGSFPALTAFEAEMAGDVGSSPTVSAFRPVADDRDPIAGLVADPVAQMKAAESGQDANGSAVHEGVEMGPVGESVLVHEQLETGKLQHLGSLDPERERILVPVLDHETAESKGLNHLQLEDEEPRATNVPPPPAVRPNGYAGARRYNYPAMIGIPLIVLVFGVLGYALLGSAAAETTGDVPAQENAEPSRDSIASQPLSAATPETAISLTEEGTTDPSSEDLFVPEERTRGTKSLESVSERTRPAESDQRAQSDSKKSSSQIKTQTESPASSRARRSARPRVVADDASDRAPVSSIESILTGIPTDRARRQQQRQWEVLQEDQLRRERRQRRIDRRNRQNWPPF